MHISDELELLLGMLVGVAMRTPGLAGQGLQGTVVAGTPEVDVGPVFVVLPAGTAYSVLLSVDQQRLAVFMSCVLLFMRLELLP